MTDCYHTEQSDLSIRVDTDGLAFAVSGPLSREGGEMETERWEVDVTRPLAANLREAFHRMEWLGRPFRRVNVLMATRRFTSVPLEFFDEGMAEDFFYRNHLRAENEAVLHNVLRNSGAVLLFGMDRSVAEAVRELQPEAGFYAQVSPLIDGFAVKGRLDGARRMYVHVRREYIDVLCFEGGRLLLAIAFRWRAAEDCAYYVLCVWQMLGFDQMEDGLHLLGCVEEKEGLADRLKEFVRQATVMEPAGEVDLQMIRLCE